MSVGGLVIEVLPDPRHPDRVWVNTKDWGEECAIYLEPGEEKIVAGDNVWWQGGHAYWTPKNKSRCDVRLKRTSYSGVSRPDPNAKPETTLTVAELEERHRSLDRRFAGAPLDEYSSIDIAAALIERIRDFMPPFIRAPTAAEEEEQMQTMEGAVRAAAMRGWKGDPKDEQLFRDGLIVTSEFGWPWWARPWVAVRVLLGMRIGVMTKTATEHAIGRTKSEKTTIWDFIPWWPSGALHGAAEVQRDPEPAIDCSNLECSCMEAELIADEPADDCPFHSGDPADWRKAGGL